MKKILLITLGIILTLPIFGQIKDTVYVSTPIFDVIYSQKFQQPLSVRYNVLCPKGTASRNGLDFYKNDSIITSDDEDYYNNVWDKGHLAPAAAFNSFQGPRLSFSCCKTQLRYVNVFFKVSRSQLKAAAGAK